MITAFRGSNILNAYRFRGEIRRTAISMEFVRRAESDVTCLNSRADFKVYLRTIDRQLRK